MSASITKVPTRQDYIITMFSSYFARKFYQQHEAEVNSTSPYAITQEVPTMRIVDNPITSGSGSTSPISSRDHYGILGGYKGSSVSGGGGSWKMDTKVQFDHISKCPVTGREFTDKELKDYQDNWWRDIRDYGNTEARHMKFYSPVSSLEVYCKYYNVTFIFDHTDLESLQMQARSGDELVDYIESHEREGEDSPRTPQNKQEEKDK